jgi:glycosyltransferase involved in cell wall biosynthesis
MRLVFVNRFFHPDHSATSQILSDLCFALAARGHDVHVVTSRLRYDDPSLALPANETASGVAVHRVWTTRFGRGTLPGRAMDYLTFYLSALWRLARLADRNTVLVAKTDPPMISVAAALAARATGARLVNWTQDLFPEVAVAAGMRAMPAMLARPLAVLRDWSLRCAVRNVAIGERMRARLVARGLPEAKLAVIHNWADGAAIAPQGAEGGGAEASPLRREWGLEEKFVVGYSGNLGRVHEFATVLDAAGQLADRDDIVFLFIGGGHRLGAVKGEAARRGLSNVQFRPYQPRERLAQSLGACDAHLVTLRPELEGLVLPSKFYGIIAAGRPVMFVGAADGEIAGLVNEARCGQAFRVGDAPALAQCLRGLADEPARGRGWGGNARRLFDARFAMPIAVDRWERVLAGAVQG